MRMHLRICAMSLTGETDLSASMFVVFGGRLFRGSLRINKNLSLVCVFLVDVDCCL